MTRSKYSRSAGSTFAAMVSGRPVRTAMSMATSGPFSGEMRPRNARYRPWAVEKSISRRGMPW